MSSTAQADWEEPGRSPGRPGVRPRDADRRPARFIDRELSLLDFNARVLALAEDGDLPLLERAKFMAIFSSNLDEFFQVRVAGLKSRQVAGLGPGPGTGTPTQQLEQIRKRVTELVEIQSRLFSEEICPGLAAEGITISNWGDLAEDDRQYLDDVFADRIFPVLTPLAVDPGHPFPYISNLSLNLAVFVQNPDSGDRRFARVKVPPVLPRFIATPSGTGFVPLEQVIAAHLPTLFSGLEVDYQCAFRVTRNVDLTPQEDEEADDLLAAVEIELRRRRFGEAVRLEIDAEVSPEVLDLLMREIEVSAEDVYRVQGPLDLAGLWAIYGVDRPELKDRPWPGVTPPAFERASGEAADLFSVIAEGDLLAHHPYESFSSTTEEFIRQASTDPRVMAIKMTLYRTSGDSPIIKALIRAAERGKQVAALVELKARFDEQANIAWARALEEAGVHVVYGLVGLKTHSKVALVVRNDDDGIRRYCHFGTGNYNPATARIYEDLSLFTADPDLGADLTDLFNFLTGYSRQSDYRKILVAPVTLRHQLLELIDRQVAAGPAARIIWKINHLVDPEVIEALYAASEAGVGIDLVVRGTCSLIPGVEGMSDNIRIRSILGRYLEHSRIYVFGPPEAQDTTYLIGSADAMERNLDRRVEALVPVASPALRRRLREVLEVSLADDTQAWSLGPDGGWERVMGGQVSTQASLAALAAQRASNRAELDVVTAS
ncbi:MAG TPA: polyphosphate kinase 1 [Acidimicrobiales bacterium]|nr:polyphosphate kinase 1 [Acidimicrobiales bacterium]